jgi:hypothetical protein
LLNSRQNTAQIVCHFVIPETDNDVALRLKKSGSPVVIVPGRRVLASIDFDHKPMLAGYEVADVLARGKLAIEAHSCEFAGVDRPQSLRSASVASRRNSRDLAVGRE